MGQAPVSPPPSVAPLHPFVNQPEFFQAILENTSDIVSVVDEHGVLCYQTPSVKAILGFEPNEGLGEVALGNIHFEDREIIAARLQTRFSEKDEFLTERTEVRVRHKLGGWRTLAVTSSTLMIYNGKPYLVTTAHDITEQKRTEAEEISHRQFADALRGIAATLNRTHNFEALLDRTLEQVQHVIPHTTANVALVQDGKLRFVRHKGYEEQGLGNLMDELIIPIEELPVFKREALAKGVALVADTAAYPHWQAEAYNAWTRSHLSASIDVQDQPAGLISLTSHRPNFFTQRDAVRLVAFASQVAVAIENSSLFAEYEQAIAREQQLNAITRLFNSSLDLVTILREVLRFSINILRGQGGVIGLTEPDGEQLRLVHSQNLPVGALAVLLPRGQGVAWEAAEMGRAVLVADYPAHHFARPSMVAAGVRQMLVVPMMKGGACIGVLQLTLSQAERQVNPRDIETLQAIANQAAIAVENARLFEETQHRMAELNALYRASAALLTTTNLKLLGEQITAAAVAELTHTYCCLLLYNEHTLELQPLAETNPNPSTFSRRVIPLAGPGLIPAAAQAQAPIYTPNVDLDARYVNANEWAKSEFVIPLLTAGKLIGVLNWESPQWDAFSERQRRVLMAFAERAAMALQNALLFQEIEQAAQYTTLLNKMTQAALQAKSFDQLTQALADRLQGVLNADGSALMIVDPATRQVRHRAVSASIRAEFLAYRQLGQPLLLEQLVENAAGTLVLEDVQQASMVDPSIRAVFKVQALVAVRLMVDNQPTGFAAIVFRQPRHFSAAEIEKMQQAGREISLAIAHRSLLQRMDAARQMAEEANRLKTEFLANTSHELRTPLSGIIGALELARDETHPASVDGRVFVDAAYQAAQNLGRVIDDLMDIAKIEAGKLHIDLQPTPIALVIQEVVSLSRALAEKKNLRLDLRLTNETLPFVYVDADRTRQILLNVVGNAIKFTAQGGVTITLERVPSQRKLSIQVRDTGIGIQPDQQERLFQPFVQADGSTSRQYGGTGLGLSISRRLAELMHGSLTLQSEGLDKGSTFTLTLPLA
jgi:PAS domain S-box-containing protein